MSDFSDQGPGDAYMAPELQAGLAITAAKFGCTIEEARGATEFVYTVVKSLANAYGVSFREMAALMGAATLQAGFVDSLERIRRTGSVEAAMDDAEREMRGRYGMPEPTDMAEFEAEFNPAALEG